MTTLMAGFAPFPGAPYNASGDLICHLQGRKLPDSVAVVLLPVGWDESWQVLAEAIEASKPRNVVLFGLHMKAERLRLELSARNRRELGRKDAFGGFPAGPTVLDGPECLPARMPWARIAGLLREECVDFEWSTDAGAYLCNDTFYRLSHNAMALGIENYGFIHVPVSDERIDDLVVSDVELPSVFNSISSAKLSNFAIRLGALLDSGGAERQPDDAFQAYKSAAELS